MQTLREKLDQESRFLVGCELVSVRGSMAESSAIKARAFANQLVESPEIDWISITDNAGGNPQLAPMALGKPVLYAGKEVVIHLTCKDLNRNALESEAWLLHSEGFNNVLAMTGDYPQATTTGSAKPVFDIDSVALISKLHEMNEGLELTEGRKTATRLGRTAFNIGAVVSNYKLLEGECMPQYYKLAKKVENGARFIINQVGYDARKSHELRVYMDDHGMRHVPLIGNVYVLNGRVARIFHDDRVPGVVVSDALLALCERQAAAPDKGRAFFQEFAAKQIAIFRGLGYRGVYLGGVHDFAAPQRILDIARTFGPDDWKEFAREISFSRPQEFFHYAPVAGSGLIDPARRAVVAVRPSTHVGVAYALSKFTHDLMFTPGRGLSALGAKLCAEAPDPMQGPRALRVLERASKAVLFDCRDCGDCSLPEISFLCPESQCAKNQRNGPCGGTHGGTCEVAGVGDCIWLRAYERAKHDGREDSMLDHAPAVQNQALRGTSSWANTWLGRDHMSRTKTLKGPTS